MQKVSSVFAGAYKESDGSRRPGSYGLRADWDKLFGGEQL